VPTMDSADAIRDFLGFSARILLAQTTAITTVPVLILETASATAVIVVPSASIPFVRSVFVEHAPPQVFVLVKKDMVELPVTRCFAQTSARTMVAVCRSEFARASQDGLVKIAHSHGVRHSAIPTESVSLPESAVVMLAGQELTALNLRAARSVSMGVATAKMLAAVLKDGRVRPVRPRFARTRALVMEAASLRVIANVVLASMEQIVPVP